MSTESNKAVVQQFFDTLNHGNLAALDGILASNYRAHFAGVPFPLDRESFTGFFSQFAAAFPDQQHHVEEMFAEHDRVAVRLVIRGTHQGSFQGVPATGKAVTITGINIMHVADGKIQEHWSEGDNLGLMQQLGVIPAPQGA